MFDMGLRLRELRDQKRLSMPELADRIGVSKSTIQRYENNTQSPTAENIKKLALLHGVSADYLLGLEHRETIVVEGLSRPRTDLILALVRELQQKE